MYNTYTIGSGDLTENTTAIKNGTIGGDLYNNYIDNNLSTGAINKNKLEINNGIVNGSVYNTYTIGNNDLIDNETIISGGIIKQNLFVNYSIGNGNLNENKLNISNIDVKGDVINTYSSGIGNLNNNKITINNGIVGKDLYNIYSIGDKNITGNELIITDGTIKNNLFNIYSDGAGNISNNSLIIIGGNIKNDIYTTFTNNSGAVIDSSKLFIGYNVDTYGNIYVGVLEKTENEKKVMESFGDNNRIFVNKDLSYMENQGKGIYTGIGDNNYLYFFGKNINLLNNNVIKDNVNIILANGKIINNEFDNIEIEKQTNIIINKNIDYTNGNNILFGDEISIDLYLNNINMNEPIISTKGKIKALDEASFIDDKKIIIDSQSLSEYSKYIIFQGSSIDDKLVNAFKLAEKSFIKNVIVDQEKNQIKIETYTNFNGVMKSEESLNDLKYFREFTKSMDDAISYMSQPKEKEKYKDEIQNKLLKDLIFVFNDNNSKIPIYGDQSFIESLLKGWLPDLSGSIYKTSRDNFLHLSNKINSRLENLIDYATFEKNNFINKYRKSSYNYLIVKSMEDNQKIFEYDYSPIKTKRTIAQNWFEIFDGETDQKKDGAIESFKSNNTGFIFGKEIIYDNKVMFGGTFNYNLSKINNINKNINTNSFGLSTYLRYNFNDNLYFNGIISYAYDLVDEKTKNNLNFKTVTNTGEKINIENLKFKSNFGSNQFFTNVSVGLNSDFISPQVGLNYNVVFTDSYRDNYNNSINKNTYESLIAFSSLTFKNFADIEYDIIKIKPKLFGRINYGIKKANLKISGKLNGSSKYNVKVGDIDEKSFQYGGNLDLEFFNFINISLSYESIYGKNYTNNEIGLKANLLW